MIITCDGGTPMEIIIPEGCLMMSRKENKYITLYMRSFIHPNVKTTESASFGKQFNAAYVSVDKYQILMYVEPE